MNAPARGVVFCTVAVANGGLVFADPERARAVSRIDAALSESRTWGEFRAAMDPEEYERLVSTMFDEEGLERPTPETPFRAEEVPGYCDAEAGVDPMRAPREIVIDTRELARGVPARAETHPAPGAPGSGRSRRPGPCRARSRGSSAGRPWPRSTRRRANWWRGSS